MKTGLLKKAGVLLMAAAVTVGSVWCVGKKSSAAENDLKSIYSSGDVNAEAGVEQTHEFSVEAGKSVFLHLFSECSGWNDIILQRWNLFGVVCYQFK